MSYLLAADIGGTKTLLQCQNEQGEVLLQRRYDSQIYADFDSILSDFLVQEPIDQLDIEAACIAVAGPVNGKFGYVTNLPWQLDADALAAGFAIGKVILCNDFEAVGYGVGSLTQNELKTLQHGHDVEKAPRAVIGAGTGLGQAIIIPTQAGWQVLATEGGHCDFAPQNSTQVLLLEHLIERYGHVSYDRLLSGSGLVTIYHFLRDYQQQVEDPALRLAMIEGDAAAAISEYALSHNNALANEALDMFMSIYGAQAGNLALATLPRGGLYIAGGIAGKIIEKFEQGEFMTAFHAKGRMQSLMGEIPVHVIKQPEVGLHGAAVLAQNAMYNEHYD